ncbi:hypothetical protein [Paenibacillus polymyxa]|nr:hypothetical protein [Paenibacillus polymyxa]
MFTTSKIKHHEMWGEKATERLRRLSVAETEESIREQIREIL